MSSFELEVRRRVETRNPKAEIRKKSEGRNPNNSCRGQVRISGFGLRVSAFTLLELMIVVGIMGLVMTIGVPFVYKVWHRAPMAEALKDVVEVCSNARAQSIMQGQEVDVIFHPRDGRFEISGGAAIPISSPTTIKTSHVSTSGLAHSGRSAQFSDKIRIDMLDINKLKHDFRDDEVARIRFFPNGTSDELTLILSSDRNEQRGVTLEVTTGLATVLSEADLQKLRNGTL